jgi:hypothetical protein
MSNNHPQRHKEYPAFADIPTRPATGQAARVSLSVENKRLQAEIAQLRAENAQLIASNASLTAELSGARYALNQHASPLMRLPREIRDHILAPLLIRSEKINFDGRGSALESVFNAAKKEAGADLKKFPSVMQASQQLRDEAAGVFYSQNTFAMDFLALSSWKTVIPLQHKRLINNLELRETKGVSGTAQEHRDLAKQIRLLRQDKDLAALENIITLPAMAFRPLSRKLISSRHDIVILEKGVGARRGVIKALVTMPEKEIVMWKARGVLEADVRYTGWREAWQRTMAWDNFITDHRLPFLRENTSDGKPIIHADLYGIEIGDEKEETEEDY